MEREAWSTKHGIGETGECLYEEVRRRDSQTGRRKDSPGSDDLAAPQLIVPSVGVHVGRQCRYESRRTKEDKGGNSH